MAARFITVEGIEGVGKTTNVGGICRWLEARGIPFIATREPGGTRQGEHIRNLLLDVDGGGLDAMAELLLLFAARAQHLAEKIRPALAAGQWVVCDRFTDATYAYQGGGRGIDSARIAALEQLVQGDLRPDLTIVLDLAPALGLERVRQRGARDRFECEQLAFFERTRAVYLARAAAQPARYRCIDAARSLELVQAEIGAALADLLPRAGP